MPAKPLLSVRALGTLALPLPTLVLLSAGRALAAPSPSSNPCDLIHGPARDYCQGGHKTSPGTSGLTGGNPLDPLSSLAQGCAKAATAVINALSDIVQSTSNVDFTNPLFRKQYAIVFAASAILTLVLWLLAVAKRAVRGVPLTEAISEAVGFLWLTVLASAFTPLVLYVVVSATDGVTNVISQASGAHTDQFFGGFSQALQKGTGIGGGPIMLIIVSLVSVLAAGVLLLELVIRAALLYVGALLGVVVYAGLVDKNMWGHVRRWAGIMIAVIMVKPIIVIVLGIAGALSGDDGPDSIGAVVSGLAIILLAIFASAMIYRFVPGFGDEIASARANKKQSTEGSRAAAVISSPAALVSQGIQAHSARGQGGSERPQSAATPARTSDAVSGGMSAHGSRGGTTPAPPAPRSAPGSGSGSSPTGHPGGTGSARSGRTAGGDGR
ncbi:hypothetical protein ACFV3R_33165 [Streptomyces sp. NPDC059740]|uniref:hypothetical protein n=1 Tax=Streptomyces sp. NPDC059740 TaxID=3346926 RepID=UPI003665A245